MAIPTPPGWYPDPEGRPDQQRYWDGTRWSEQWQPSPGGPGTSALLPGTVPHSPTPGAFGAAPAYGSGRRLELTGGERFWYVVQCIYFGAGYLAKVPTKKALSELGLVELTDAEKFWYVVLCIWFGAGYFAKVPVKKALNDAGLVQLTTGEQFWYVIECISWGSGYFAKCITRKALSDAGILAMTGAGQFWYIVGCICFGYAYLHKVPQKKALSELPALPAR